MMGRKTRWTTRIIIIMVVLCLAYIGWHITKAIKVYKETYNLQPQEVDYSENGYNRHR